MVVSDLPSPPEPPSPAEQPSPPSLRAMVDTPVLGWVLLPGLVASPFFPPVQGRPLEIDERSELPT